MSQGSVYARGWVPHTCIAMASSVRIFSKNGTNGNFKQIGLVQSFKPTDTRKMERARGIGFGDRVAEIVPGTTDVSITVTRMALYEENILESFGYHTAYNRGGVQAAVRTLAHTKNPFDINEVLVFHARRGEAALPGFAGGNERLGFFPQEYTSFWYHDCWINNWSRTIEITGNLIYMEDVTIDVTWVSDGIEPGPYQDTDVWDTHGLDCNTRGFKVFDPGFNTTTVAGLDNPNANPTKSLTAFPSGGSQAQNSGTFDAHGNAVSSRQINERGERILNPNFADVSF